MYVMHITFSLVPYFSLYSSFSFHSLSLPPPPPPPLFPPFIEPHYALTSHRRCLQNSSECHPGQYQRQLYIAARNKNTMSPWHLQLLPPFLPHTHSIHSLILLMQIFYYSSLPHTHPTFPSSPHTHLPHTLYPTPLTLSSLFERCGLLIGRVLHPFTPHTLHTLHPPTH